MYLKQVKDWKQTATQTESETYRRVFPVFRLHSIHLITQIWNNKCKLQQGEADSCGSTGGTFSQLDKT